MNDIQFFKKYQKQLVWFINTKIGRWFFKVDKEIKNVCNVTPNALTYDKHLQREANGKWREVKTTCFRTNNKYARLLNYRLAPLHKLALLLPSLARPELSPLFVPVMLTVDTYYPDAHSESTSVDGVAYNSTATSWSNLRNGSGSGYNDDRAIFNLFRIRAATSTDIFSMLTRSIFLFDTSSIPDSNSIDDATLSIYGYDKTNSFSGDEPNINIYSSNPASNTALEAGDFDSLGETAFSTAITYTSFSTAGYNNFTLNASGIAAVSKTSVTKLGGRNANYDVANTSPIWASGADMNILVYFAEQTGTSQDPKLTVTHSAVATFIPQIIFS